MINCLYIDDEPALLEIAKEFLETNDDVKVTTCDAPKNVETILDERHYDIIISDYQMPGMNGIELFDHVRRAGFEMPFILFTGKGREEVAISALNAGIDFYLTKGGAPVAQFTELENVIRQLVRRNEAESALSYNERKFGIIIENIPGVVLIVDDKGMIKYASPFVRSSLGYRPEEILGTNAFSYLHSSHQFPTTLPESMAASAGIDPVYEFKLRDREGEYKWFEGMAKPMPKEFGEDLFIMSAWMIDERKRMESAMANSERTLRAVFDNSSEFMVIVSLDGTIRSVNRRACESTGYSEMELIGSQVMNLVAPSSLDFAMAKLAEKVKGEALKTTYKMIMRSKDGRDIGITIATQRIDNNEEGPFVIVTGLEDRILDNAYYEMLGTKEYLELMIESANNLIIGVDRHGRINVFNNRIEEFTGIPASTVIGVDIRDLIKGDTRYAGVLADALIGFDRYVSEGTLDESPSLVEMMDNAGNERKILWKSNKLTKGEFYYGLVISGVDVTEV